MSGMMVTFHKVIIREKLYGTNSTDTVLQKSIHICVTLFKITDNVTKASNYNFAFDSPATPYPSKLSSIFTLQYLETRMWNAYYELTNLNTTVCSDAKIYNSET